MKNRNPWQGIHSGREFLYDLRHPIAWGRRGFAGLHGWSPEMLILLTGIFFFVGGIIFIVLGVLHGQGIF